MKITTVQGPFFKERDEEKKRDFSMLGDQSSR